MSFKKICIAIDGPAAAGKSTVARVVAERLSYIYVDTGAMYRALTLKALKENVDVHSENELVQLLLNTEIDLQPIDMGQAVYLDQQEVTEEIRGTHVTNTVSTVAAHKLVRQEMVARQKQLAIDGGIVMDGRDIGTHVLPQAELKVFLLASVEVRAMRRHKENLEKGFSSDLSELKEEIILRDKQDSERTNSPLVQAEDAIVIDTSLLSIAEVVEKILALAKERIDRV